LISFLSATVLLAAGVLVLFNITIPSDAKLTSATPNIMIPFFITVN
jgi:uncharacterized membrane protein